MRAGTTTDVLTGMDASEITAVHWKILFISGMGFFTDAYDLFIIGVVGLTRFAGSVCGGVREADPVLLSVRSRFHS
jgi:hypothetical protein